jgi:hypothetical protein
MATASANVGAIERTALDYIEGWFDGDASRMERALHPELAKRSLQYREDGREALETITAQEMIDDTASGRGKSKADGDLRIEVTVDHVFGETAIATVDSGIYVDYLQLIRTAAGWKIVNVLWKRR